MSLISVIIPIYNVEKYLNRCIESVVTQSYKNLEIILVDDGSSDRCPEMCDEWMKRDKRIKVIHKKNGGLSDARNAGMKIAIGKYVSFIDSDDWIENKFFEILMDTINRYQCDVVGCRYRKTTDMKQTKNIITETICYNCITAIAALIDNKIEQVVWNKVYKKDMIKDILFEKGKYHEDEFWSYQVLGRIHKYVEVDYIGYNYFIRSNSIMGKKYSLNRLDAIEAKVYRQVYLEKNFPELALKGKINLLFSCLYQGQLSLKELKKDEKNIAIEALQEVVLKYPIYYEELKKDRITQAVWLLLEQRFFVFTCKMRNIIGIGI